MGLETDPIPRDLEVVGGKYRLERRIAEGAMGVVYLGRHVDLARRFALKLLKGPLVLDDTDAARFRREAQVLGRLQHPNIVQVTDYGLHGSTPYLVMEHLDGITLADRIHRQGRLSPAEAIPMLGALAQAIDAAHEQGVLHRDLKPSNVLLVPAPDGALTVKVVDFGLARLLRDVVGESAPPDGPRREGERTPEPVDLTGSGDIVGTPAYASPEAVRGQPLTPASDIYSFAVLAYETLLGQRPFEGAVAQVARQHLAAEPPPPAAFGVELPEGVWAAVSAALSKEPSRRPRTAGALAEQIARAWRWDLEGRQERQGRWRRLIVATPVLLLAWVSGVWVARAPLGAGIERWTVDLGFAAKPPHAADRRLLLVVVDNDSLRAGPLADRADEFGATLRAVLEAGAARVGIDLAAHAKWSESSEFARLLLSYPERVTLAATSAADGRVVGLECVNGLVAVALGPRRTADLFGFVNLAEDPDGVVRKAYLSYRDRDGAPRPSWAAHAAGRRDGLGSSPFFIDASVSPASFERVSWRALPAAVLRDPAIVRGRIVLVGGEAVAADDDAHRIAGSTVSGLMLQAMIVNTLLTGAAIERFDHAMLVAALVALLVAAIALYGRRSVSSLLVATSVVAFCVLVGWATVVYLDTLISMASILAAGAASLLLSSIARALPWVRRPMT